MASKALRSTSADFKKRNPSLFGTNASRSEAPAKLMLLEHRDKYDSEAERLVAETWLPRQDTLIWGHHELSIILPGGRYTPDFHMILSDGVFCVIEVKGILRGKFGQKITRQSHRDSRAKFRAARELWSWARFVWLEVENGIITEIL